MSSTASPAAPRPVLPPWLSRKAVPGLLLAAGLSLAAIILADVEERLTGHLVIEAIVLALLFGVAARNLLPAPAPFVPGTNLASKQILELGVGILGASVDLRQVFKAGPALLAVAVLGVAGGIAFGYLIGRTLQLNHKLAILVAVGNAICGNSAIAAVAPVIKAEAKDIASAIALTAVLGVCLVLSLPLLIPLFNLSHYQYGVLAGMAVYAVPQVVAAAFPVSQISGDVATLVKLTRVLLLGPVVVFFAVLSSRRGATGARLRWQQYVPWFVAMFLILTALRSTGLLPSGPAGTLREISRVLTILAMAGLGFGVDLTSVTRAGPRVGAAVICSLLFMIGLTLTLIPLLEIEG